MSSSPNGDLEARVNQWVRIWRLLNAPISWASGLGLFMWLTFTNAGTRQPEWYAIVAGLLGSPVITLLWGKPTRSKDDPE